MLAMMNEKLRAYRDSLTQEQKDALLAKAHAARKAKAAQREANKSLIKTHYLDAGHWADLATKHKIRMPSNLEPVKASVIVKYLKRAGLSIDVWDEHYTSTKYFCKHNPLWSCYAAAGLVLELKEKENKI